MSLIFRSGLLKFVGGNSLFAAEVFTKARIYFHGLSDPGNPAALFELAKEFSEKKRKSEIFIERLKDPALKASCSRFLFRLESSLNSVEAAVRDFQLPGVEGDEFISEMAFALQTGAKEIYNASASGGAGRSRAVLKAKRACNSVERAYRRAVTALGKRSSVSALKIEGVYKGLSDAGDSLDAAADATAGILCK